MSMFRITISGWTVSSAEINFADGLAKTNKPQSDDNCNHSNNIIRNQLNKAG